LNISISHISFKCVVFVSGLEIDTFYTTVSDYLA